MMVQLASNADQMATPSSFGNQLYELACDYDTPLGASAEFPSWSCRVVYITTDATCAVKWRQ